MVSKPRLGLKATGVLALALIAIPTSLKGADYSTPTVTSPPTQTVLRTTLTITNASNGQTFSNYRISTTSGDCVDMNGVTGVTFENSDVGPCGGRGIYVNGGENNSIYDSYIHVEGASTTCCDSRDGIFIDRSNFATIQGNVVAYSESNIEAFADNLLINGNFLLNPQGRFPRGQQIQTGAGADVTISNNLLVSTRDATLGPAIGTDSTALILMSQGANSNPPEDSINIYTTHYANIEGNYITGGLDATTPYSGGAQSPSGCGILIDSDKVIGADHADIANNVVVNTGQCGIGVGTGINQTVTRNKVINVNSNDGGNTAIYIWKQYPPGCGPVLLNGNLATEVKPGGYSSGYWNGGGCAPVTCDGVDTHIDSCNTFDYGTTNTAQKLLLADPTIRTPPLIPPLPKHCVVRSPYSTQTSLPPC